MLTRRDLLGPAVAAALVAPWTKGSADVIPEGRGPNMANSTDSASKPPTELQTLIDTHIDSFNTQNRERFVGVFGDKGVIIDGIAPYLWLSPNGPAHWLDDVEKWRKALGVTAEHVSYKMGFWNVEGNYAYAVISGTLAVTIKGQPIVRTGTLAYTFAKHATGWKIEAQAWGRTS